MNELLNALQSPTLSIRRPGVSQKDEVVAVRLNQPTGARIAFRAHGYTAELAAASPKGKAYDVYFALKTDGGEPQWHHWDAVNDLVIAQVSADHDRLLPFVLPLALTPLLLLQTGPVAMVISPPAQQVETSVDFSLEELRVLTNNEDLQLPLLIREEGAAVHTEICYAHDYYDKGCAHDFHFTFTAPAGESVFRLEIAVQAEGLDRLAELFSVQLRRFVLCYQQFHQLHAHFVSFDQVPALIRYYSCTWSFKEPYLQEHVIRWSLGSDHAVAYMQTKLDETFAGAPYLHSGHVPAFSPSLMQGTLERLTPLLQQNQLCRLSC